MKVGDMSPEDAERKRAYDREHKAKSRAKKKALAKAAEILTADEAEARFAEEYPERVTQLDHYVKDFATKVTEELGRELGFQTRTGPNHDEEFVLDQVARCLLGLKKGWIQHVQVNGELVAEFTSGFYFADACGSIIENANRYGLRKSPTFDSAYLELLGLIVQRYPVSLDLQNAQLELEGKYTLPKPPEMPAPHVTEVKPVSQVPSTAAILEQGRKKLTEQLPPDVLRYLNGN